jgi:FixJ family two-component response regulator
MGSEVQSVFVVDDDVSVREAVQNLLRSVGLKVEAFGTAEEFLSSKKLDSSGCLVLDVRMPGLSGLDLQAQLAELNRQMPIVFITAHGDIPMSVRAIKRGAVEFLTKPFRDQDLLDAVCYALSVDQERRQRETEIAEVRERYESLTNREQEVLRQVVQGLMNKQIAAELGISEPTVKLHRGRMMEKMEAESLADLIKMAQAVGVVKRW